MNIGLISDIHCNLSGFRSALDLLSDCDEILCAGDLLYQYRFSNEVLELIQEHGVRAIVGNHDKTILHTPFHPLRDSPTIDASQMRYLAELPSELIIDLGGLRLAMFHGSPWDEAGSIQAQYVYPTDHSTLRRMSNVEADVIVLGHTHIPFHMTVGQALVVNSGSCGECRDGTETLSCMRLDTATREIELRRFPVTRA